MRPILRVSIISDASIVQTANIYMRDSFAGIVPGNTKVSSYLIDLLNLIEGHMQLTMGCRTGSTFTSTYPTARTQPLQLYMVVKIHSSYSRLGLVVC